MPHFFMFEFFEMPHFSYLILKMGKMGHFKKFEHKKVGQFKKLIRDQFQNRKRTENEILRFWGISKNYEKALTWQNPLSHVFGAFHDTSCKRLKWYIDLTNWRTEIASLVCDQSARLQVIFNNHICIFEEIENHRNHRNH